MAFTDPRSDDDLIAAANAGETAAFEALYHRYRDWVVNLAFRFTRNREDALDVLQDAFAYFYGKFPGFTLTARLTTFLYPAVRNLSISRLRQGQRTRALDDRIDPPAPDAPETGRRDDLRVLLDLLPEGEREVLLLRFVDGLALKEIGEALAIPLGTVKSRLHHALTALRDDPRTQKYFNP